MAYEFKLPDLGEGLHEAEITEILVKKGDQVKEGDSILSVETDKASVDIPSPYTGVVEQIHISAGDVVEVGTTLITFDGQGESPVKEQTEHPKAEPSVIEQPRGEEPKQAQPKAEQAKTAEQPATAAESGKPAVSAAQAAQPNQPTGPVAAAPTTRQLARELKIDIKMVPGSGPGGRITEEDVRRFAESGGAARPAQATPVGQTETQKSAAPSAKPAREPGERSMPALISEDDLALPDFSSWGNVEEIPLRSIRKAVAKKMAASWSQIPHVNHNDEADITELDQLRKSLKDEVQGLTMTVFLIKAAVAALKMYPNFNASLDTDRGVIIQKHFYNIGVATDTERGLIVPVIRDADRKSMVEISRELGDLVTRTRDDKNTLEDIQRGTFTITNAGVLGGTHFNPIINYPQVAILGAAKAAWKPVVKKDDYGRMEIIPRFMLPLSITFDHRVLDGGDGARFLNTIIKVLEKPEQLLLNI